MQKMGWAHVFNLHGFHQSFSVMTNVFCQKAYHATHLLVAHLYFCFIIFFLEIWYFYILTFVNFPWSHNLHPWQEKLFGGYPSVDVLKRKINKLLGVAVSDGQEIKDAPRNPPWVQCCLKSYYIDRNDIWGSRQYRIFDTKISG